MLTAGAAVENITLDPACTTPLAVMAPSEASPCEAGDPAIVTVEQRTGAGVFRLGPPIVAGTNVYNFDPLQMTCRRIEFFGEARPLLEALPLDAYESATLGVASD